MSIQVLGQYHVVKAVGRDDRGVTWAGVHRVTGQRAVLSVLPASRLTRLLGKPFRNRFFQEARRSCGLRHPHLVPTWSFGLERGWVYVVEPPVAGVSLADRLAEESPPAVRDVLQMGLQAAGGLHFAHQQGMVHKNLRPSSLLVGGETGHVWVTDFGLSRIIAEHELNVLTRLAPRAVSYMSPEQVRGLRLDPRSDVFSLGSILYEALAGRPPFQGTDRSSLMLRISRDRPQALRSLNPRVPRLVEGIIGKAMEKDPARRYQEMACLADHLARVLLWLDEILAKRRQGAEISTRNKGWV